MALATTQGGVPLTQFKQMLASNRDVLLPLAIIGILFIMIVPVPPFLLDLLLTVSIAASLLMLFIGIYIVKALDFSVFPSMLLVVTLFRLALNIATTRLILLHGNEGTDAAGGLIESFGEFVVGGNYVVGLIIFAILIVINFVVITKGAGRVAEVAARFTLDAMPGKQMSIDADLNAGLINEEQARERRVKIEQEADFYGSMDGASKFVRGDAIAGIMILLINIIGGLIIGVLQHGMDVAMAARNYTLLTVGDGLVSQIPSLIVSTAAGLVVTRAAGETNLSQTVSRQVLFQPKAMAVAAAMLMVFAIMPGMPIVPFTLLAAIIGFCSWSATQAMRRRADKEIQAQLAETKVEAAKPEKADTLLPLDLISLEVGYGLIGLVDADQKGDLLERLKELRRHFAQDWGFVVPPVHIRDNMELRPTAYGILIKGCVVASVELKAGHLLAMAADDADGAAALSGIPTTEPAFGMPALWIHESKREQAQALGFTVVDQSTVIATHLTEVLKAHAHELLTRQEVQNLIDALKKKYLKVVEGVVPEILPLGLIQKILQNLLKEQVSIRDMLTIVETMADRTPQVKDSDLLTEYVRQALARHITRPYVTDDNRLQVLVLDREIEDQIMRHTRVTEQGLMLTMDPDSAQRMLAAIERAIDQVGTLSITPILTCLPACRSPLRKLTEKFFPQLIILSHNEIPPSVKVESLGIVGLSHAGV